MRAIVTGSSGFIGAALAKQLIAKNWEVFGVDSHSNYYSTDLKRERLGSLVELDHFEFEEMNVSERNKFSKLVNLVKPDTIFHLAAQAGVRIPATELEKYVESNLTGFSSVLQAAVVEKVPNLLFASSSSVYGNGATLPYSENENSLLPTSFYGATKLSNEILARSIIQHSQTRARALRFFTVYGPSGRPDMAYFRVIASLISGSKFELFGDGTVERDFTFIDDCVEIICALDSELSSHRKGFLDVVNVGGGFPVSIKHLIVLANDYLKQTLDYVIAEANDNDVSRTMADKTYLQQLVGFTPKIRIEEGLKTTIEWALKPSNRAQLKNWVQNQT
jgi:UDP-glucuronate 4-epimerase